MYTIDIFKICVKTLNDESYLGHEPVCRNRDIHAYNYSNDLALRTYFCFGGQNFRILFAGASYMYMYMYVSHGDLRN